MTNVTGNGHNVHYNSALTANAYLGGLTYSLVNGGYLTPNSVIEAEARSWGRLKGDYK